MVALGLNIDHVATIRQARRTYEPDPVWAAVEAQLAGADCITVHLREDRRHIQDADVYRLKEVVQIKLNLEMGATDEMIRIASNLRPNMATLVPEGRQEITTEGGLDVSGQLARIKETVGMLRGAGLMISAFIDAEPSQVDASAEAGFHYCEIHTGPYAAAHYAARGELTEAKLKAELERVADAGRRVVGAGMQFNAGHALTFTNVQPITAIPDLCELHIGHSIISRAVFTGLGTAVREMKDLLGGTNG